MREGKRNIIAGGFLLLFCGFLVLQIPNQVGPSDGYSLSPAFFPTAITVLIAVMAVILLAQGLLNRKTDELSRTEHSAHKAGYVAGTVLVMTAYVALIPFAGFILATIAALVPLAILYGSRNWIQILMVAIIGPPAIMLFFRYTMLVLLPQGTWFN